MPRWARSWMSFAQPLANIWSQRCFKRTDFSDKICMKEQGIMRVLLTGAFGNIGSSTLEELQKQGHQVRCFDIKQATYLRKARRLAKSVEVMWGDIRQKDDVR